MRKSYFLFVLAACLCLALALPALSGDEGCELRVSLEPQVQFGGQTVRLENLKPGDEVTLNMRCIATDIQVQGQQQQSR